jgi:hypothetical protein
VEALFYLIIYPVPVNKIAWRTFKMNKYIRALLFLLLSTILYFFPGCQSDKKIADNTGASVPSKSAVKIRLGVLPLSVEGVLKVTGDEISGKIYEKLAAIKGKDRVLFRKKFDARNANRILSGRLIALGEKIQLSVNISDAEKGAIVFTKAVSIPKDSIDEKLDKVIEEIADSARVWD